MLKYFHESLKIDEEIGDKKGKALALNNIGVINYMNSNPKEKLPGLLVILLIIKTFFIKKLIHILLLLVSFSGLAQNYADKNYYLVDSLDLDAIRESDQKLIESSLELFHKATNDTSKVNALNDICANMVHEDWEKYQRLQLVLIKEAIASNPPNQEALALKKALAGALNNIGFIYDNKGNPVSALAHYDKSLKLREELGDKKGMANSYNNIGSIYRDQGNIRLALEYHTKSLQIQEEIGNKDGIASSYHNIALILQNQGSLVLALEHYEKCVKTYEELGNKSGMTSSYNGIGVIHRNQGNIELAVVYYKKSLKIAEEIGDKRGMALAYRNIGTSYKHLGDIALALAYYEKSLKLREELGDKNGTSIAYNNIAQIAFEKGKVVGPEGALVLATKSLALSEEIGYPKNIKDASGLLSKIYSKQGNFQKALEMRNLQIKMGDSLESEESIKAAANQKAKYEYEKQKALDDKDHEKQLAIEKEQQEKQQVITIAAIAGLALVLVFLFFVFNRLTVTKIQKGIIEEQHGDLSAKNMQITDSINYAKKIQKAILPSQETFNKYFQDVFIFYQPKDIVSGDFYWSYKTEKEILFTVADCTGHGVPGAFMSLIGSNILDKIVGELNITRPDLILEQLSKELYNRLRSESGSEVKDGMDLVMCSVNLETKQLQIAGAYNPMYVIRDNELIQFKTDRYQLGNPEHIATKNISLQTYDLKENDVIYLFSDGFADQKGGPNGKKYFYPTFRELLIKKSKLSLTKQRQELIKELAVWKGEREQIDDVLIIGLKI